MLAERPRIALLDEDHVALKAACAEGVGLCTIVGIDGSFSRRLGAQLAVLPDGSCIGSMSDGCLEAQLASDIARCDGPTVVRYGRGSCKIDFRLPCGGGLDILLDPVPDRALLTQAIQELYNRRSAQVLFACGEFRLNREYVPALRIISLGEDPELSAFAELCAAMRIDVKCVDKDGLVLGRAQGNAEYDAWTACLLLFHDHQWELPLVEEALAGGAFFVGAQGGEKARIERSFALAARDIPEEAVARITSPVGLIPACKSPRTLALSALSEIVAEYERKRASF